MDEDLAYELAKQREIDDYCDAHEDFDSAAREQDEPPVPDEYADDNMDGRPETHAEAVAPLRRLWPAMADRAERTRLAVLEDARRGENWSEEEDEASNSEVTE